MADYCMWQDVAQYLALGGNADQVALTDRVAAAMDAVHDYCGWRFDTTSATYTFGVCDPYDLDLGDLPLASTGTVTIAEDPNDSGVYSSTVAGSAVLYLPQNGRRSGMAWPTTTVRRVSGTWPSSALGRHTVQITGTFGWPEVPAAVKQATIAIAGWIHTNKAAPNLSEFGPPSQRIPAAERLLARYRRGALVAAVAIGGA